MALYSVDGHLATLDGGLIRDSGLAGFLYLSYFKGFSANPTVEVPEIGPTVSWPNPSNAASTTLTDDLAGTYKGVPAIYTANSYIYSNDVRDLINARLSANKTVSMEVMFFTTTFYDYWAQWGGLSMGINTSNAYFYIGANVYTGDRGIGVGLPWLASSTTEPGYHVCRIDGDKCIFVCDDDSLARRKLGLSHLAVIIDKDADRTYGYIDGKLCATLNTSNYTLSSLYVANNLNQAIRLTQFAIREGNVSFDNGTRYPYPDAPYVAP